MPDSVCDQAVRISENQYERAKSDPFTILEAVIEDHCLTLTVSRGGGCKDHDFSLLDRNTVNYSLPPQRAIKLVLDTHNDACKALISSEHSFDISPLQLEGQSEIVLMLEGVEEQLLYSY
ncbi:MAG: hypothetical protein AAF587_35570 [Bacteroidota bacterium]